jgi:hypothetical protein
MVIRLGAATTGRSPLQDHWNSQRCLGSSRTGEFADHDKKLSAAVNGSGYNVAGWQLMVESC